ncbi:MAG: carboxy terminal-processing peptidase [Parahaliea sp.]
MSLIQKNTRRLLGAFFLLCNTSVSYSAIEYSATQRSTMVDMIDQLESRHYAKLRYDDDMSSEHLDNYLDNLDGGRMFFTSADIAEFERYRHIQDDYLHDGKLEPGFTIFNRFQQRLEARLTRVVDTMKDAVAAMDFSINEDYLLDNDERAWARDEAELDDRWRRHLKNQVLSLRMSDKPEDDIAQTLVKRYRNQLKRVRQYDSQDAFQIYANALTELYDPHTNYLSPRRSENFNINMSLSLEGIGAVLQLEDEYTKVVRIVHAGPADKQGQLQPSDRILAVAQGKDGEYEDVIGWRLDEVVEKIRGPKGTTVRLQILPAKSANNADRKEITIVRNKVKLEEQAAQKKVIDVKRGDKTLKVGVIDIPAFYIDFEAMRRGDNDYKSTSRDVRKLLDDLQREDKVDGIVIDLRNNGGGSLQEANDLTGLFIEYGPTVQIRHSSRRVVREGKPIRSPYYHGPLVVLINRLSASASEIFAGAIQDYQRGIIVGDRSFGKGTVQTLINLPEGQLKLTESKFYRVSGESTQHRGVVPDVVFPAIYDHEKIGESSLDHALAWDKIRPIRHRLYADLSAVLPQLNSLFEQRSANDPDYIFLQDQVELADETRAMKSLPLNEKTRQALVDKQDSKNLAIENKRRQALGESLLSSLDELDTDDQDGDARTDKLHQDMLANSDSQTPTDADRDSDTDSNNPAAEQNDGETDNDERDVLLTEASHILIDALFLENRQYAARSEPEQASKQE